MKNKMKYIYYFVNNGLIAILMIDLIFFLIGKFIVPEVIDSLLSTIASLSNVDVIIVDTIEFTFKQPIAIMIYIMIFVFITMLLMFEYAVLITISSMVYHGQKISVKNFIRATKHIKAKFLDIKTLGLFAIFYLMVSVLGIGFDTHIISPLLISKTIMNYILNDRLLTILLLSLWSVLLYLVSNFSLSIHDVFLNHQIEESVSTREIFNENRLIILSLFVFFAFVHFCYLSLNDYAINELFVDTIVNKLPFDVLEIFLIMLLFVITVLKALILPFFSVALTIIYYSHYDLAIDVARKDSSKLLLVIALLVTFILSTNIYDIGITKSNKVMIHRAGGSNVLENSYESIEYALKNKFDAIEIDIMFSKDGEILLCHDSNLMRLSGIDANVYDLSYSEIKNIGLLDSDGKAYNFITLEEVLMLTQKELFINIELKIHGYESEDHLNHLVDLIKKYDMVDNVCVSTFEYDDLIAIEEIESDIKTVVISYYFFGDVKNLRTDGIALDIKYTNKGLVNIAKKYNKTVLIWTANTPVDIANALSFDSDYIITDEPELLLDIKEVFDTLETSFF